MTPDPSRPFWNAFFILILWLGVGTGLMLFVRWLVH
jgi:hypothetical protein